MSTTFAINTDIGTLTWSKADPDNTDPEVIY